MKLFLLMGLSACAHSPIHVRPHSHGSVIAHVPEAGQQCPTEDVAIPDYELFELVNWSGPGNADGPGNDVMCINADDFRRLVCSRANPRESWQVIIALPQYQWSRFGSYNDSQSSGLSWGRLDSLQAVLCN